MKPDVMTRKLGEAEINGKAVSFFAPPHSEPDLPWVDVLQLAKAFLPTAAAKRMVKHSQDFTPGQRAVVTVRDGARITTIMCHSMAQGLTGAIDQWNSHTGEEGPAFQAYCLAAGVLAADRWPLSFEELFAAVKNTGGPFMRGFGTEGAN